MSLARNTPFLTPMPRTAIRCLLRGGVGQRALPIGRLKRTRRQHNRMGSRQTWPQICRNDDYRGRWVALDECSYDPRTAQPTEGTVVDADEDLVALCARMQASDNRHCAILFCDERGGGEEMVPPSSHRNPPRAYH
jgi:hypothetical protein